ncbi:MAG: autotransporter outer membrane beta-barrel domain-containing protein [Burkholderiaceae bacterium]|nr:autotransporter outer membrane beta-barrel domain-containing protein [Burkholderiaceae bacterium]
MSTVNVNPSTRSKKLKVFWLGIVSCLWAAPALSEPWQNLTQPIGTLLVNPPQTALEVNQYLASLDPNITPVTYPFALTTDVTKIQTTQMLYFVRVYNESAGSFPVGSWIMRASQARGLTPAQIRDIQSLPSMPTHFTFVKVPAGIVMYTGIAKAIEGWGEGGATQSKMMGPPFVPVANFTNRQALGDCFLCYRTLAPTGNANQVAIALDRGTPQPYSSLDSVYNNLDMLYAPSLAGQFQTALESLSGEAATASQTVAFGSMSLFTEAIGQRMNRWLFQHRQDARTLEDSGNRLWASLTGARFTVDGSNGTATVTGSGAGLALGGTRQVDANTLVGWSVGAGSTNFDVSARSGNGTFNSVSLALYGIKKFERSYVAGTLAYGFGYTDLDRTVTVNELSSQQSGKVNTNMLSARLEAGYLMRVREVNVTPFIALEPAWLRQGSFSESLKSPQTDAINLGLNYQGEDVSSLPLSLGLQLDKEAVLDNGWTINPLARLSWIHEFNTTRELNAALQLLPDQTFTVSGAAAPADVAKVMLAVSARNNSGVTGFLSLSGAFSGGSNALTARVGVSIALP